MEGTTENTPSNDSVVGSPLKSVGSYDDDGISPSSNGDGDT